jgi:hypothetical protein
MSEENLNRDEMLVMLRGLFENELEARLRNLRKQMTRLRHE